MERSRRVDRAGERGVRRRRGFVLAARVLFVLAPTATVLLVGCSTTVDPAPAPTSADAGAGGAAPVMTATSELAIDEVAVYQATKATLVSAGAPVAAAKLNAPIIAGRPAYVRVYVKTIARARPVIEGALTLKRAGKPDLVINDSGRHPLPELDDSSLDGTLNFEIAPEDLTADATFSVKAGVKIASGDVVTFPTDGSMMAFGAKTSSQKLRVEFVPITYNADPTAPALTPDFGDEATLKETLFKLYPVASVEITHHAAFPWAGVVKPDGAGWDALLDAIMQVRRADNVDADVFYVGVFTPVATLEQFCASGSCILGIAPQADERTVGMRAALVLGYESRSAGSTLAQELAHAMGRAHAPCGNPQAVDTMFPYPGGGIGVWGWDVVAKTLVDPSDRYRDFMSYCSPTWTSDYTYQGIYDRLELIQQQIAAAPKTPVMPATQLRHSFRIAKDGTITQGTDLEVLPGEGDPARPGGDQALVVYEGADGKVLATTKASVVNVGGTGSRIVVAPVAPTGATRARVASYGVTALRSQPNLAR